MKWIKSLVVVVTFLAVLSAPALAQEHEGWGGEHEGEHGWWGGIWGGGDDHGGWWRGGDDDDEDGGYIPYIPYAQAGPYGSPYVNPYNIANGYGYEDGYNAGWNDHAYRREYRGSRYRNYLRGDHGYARSYGDRGRYRNWYRQSFMRGYSQGYHGRARHGR